MRSTETKITGSTALGLVAPLELEKIVSGGQTGADRAALDFAIEHQIPHGGWCPAGRKAEDGMINSRYHLTETTSGAYSERTRKNVLGSDGTVIFTIDDKVRGGSRTTVEFAQMMGKPWLHLAAKRRAENVAILRYFIQQHGIRVLNVAGTRKSEEPKAQAFRRGAHGFLTKPFDRLQLLVAIDYALSNKRFGK